MDDLLVDLDKVLDDFEAEESTPPLAPGQELKPSGYAQYIADHEERPWEAMSEVPVTDGSPWKTSIYSKGTTVPVRYDIPYEPGEKFDMSEADFAPSPSVTKSFDLSLDSEGNKTELIDGKLSPVYVSENDIHAINQNHVLQNSDYKVPVQVTDDVYSYTESPAEEGKSLTFPNTTQVVPGIEVRDVQMSNQNFVSNNRTVELSRAHGVGLNEISENIMNTRQVIPRSVTEDIRSNPTRDTFVNTIQNLPVSITDQTDSGVSETLYSPPKSLTLVPAQSQSVEQNNYISASCQRVVTGGSAPKQEVLDKETLAQPSFLPLLDELKTGDKVLSETTDDIKPFSRDSGIVTEKVYMIKDVEATPSAHSFSLNENVNPKSLDTVHNEGSKFVHEENVNILDKPTLTKSKLDALTSSPCETSQQFSEKCHLSADSDPIQTLDVHDVSDKSNSDSKVPFEVQTTFSSQQPAVVGFGNIDDIEVTEDDLEVYMKESEFNDMVAKLRAEHPHPVSTMNGEWSAMEEDKERPVDEASSEETLEHALVNEKNKLNKSFTNTDSLSVKQLSTDERSTCVNGVVKGGDDKSGGEYARLMPSIDTRVHEISASGLQPEHEQILISDKKSELSGKSEARSLTLERNNFPTSETVISVRKPFTKESKSPDLVTEANAVDANLSVMDSSNHAIVGGVSNKDEESTSDLSSSDQGSPQSPPGFGARPKDPSQSIKKNRPNSLLGLSKVSLDSPFNVAHAVPDIYNSPDLSSRSSSGSPASSNEIIQNGPCGPDHNLVNKQVAQQNMSPKIQKSLENLEIKQQIQQEQRLRMENETFKHAEPDDLIMPDTVQELNGTDEGEEAIHVEPVGSEEEVTVMRRRARDPSLQDSLSLPGPGQTRPHSWGPSGTGPSPVQKQKRPTSLSLPPRQEFNPHATDRSPPAFPFEGDEGTIQEADIAEEIETAAGEMTQGEEVYEASGITTLPDTSSAEPVSQANLQNPLGKVAPRWVPDAEAPNCMGCDARFTFTKRRHHCRACGKVFCSSCCNQKSRLYYMDSKEARVCQNCHQFLAIGSQRRGEPKQVMFSDGIRPGGDLTELDGAAESRLPPRRSGRVQKKVERLAAEEGPATQRTRKLKSEEGKRNLCLIPEDGLPPIILPTGINRDYSLEENPDPQKFMPQIKNEEDDPVIFAVNTNLFVMVKILNMDCCVNRVCWCFTTKGMCTAGQDEIVIVLECLPEEETVPRDIFCHFHTVYEEASKGNTVTDMGHTIFNQSFLDSRDHGGFLYIRPTFQCLQKLIIPNPPYVFGILLQKWETPWAKVFPLRLLLRLGAEYRYYPCPLISVRNRKPVFFEIGHTIMNLLADFRNYQYMLPVTKGVRIHMEDKQTIIMFPRNRYDDLMKVVNNSNEHVMAMGANFSAEADSHLVCIQNDDGNYQTQAINIQNKPRKVTGASFVVFNGALKSSSGLSAKSSIVEDGLMVQITPDSMVALKLAIKEMKDYTIGCGSVAVTKPEEIVVIQWVEDDKNVNIGLKSPLDKMSMDGIESIHIHNSTDYVGENRIIRWTEVFFIRNEDVGSKWEPVDLSRLAETLASACCIALTSHLDRLREASMTKVALRVTIESERVGYEIGANGEKLPDFYMNDLDDELIPVIHGAASQNHEGPIVLELVFHILD